ncbi:MAG: XdhC family protein [Coriobacteriales bacterium]|jgi:xanthine dehydrogenase accessory factor|nr:XdhC family protein [Coriobacteriales bacterium]
MSITELYRRLEQALQTGVAAAIISDYGVDGSVRKRLAIASDQQIWAEVESLEAASGARINGPVTSLTNSEGSLTLIEHYRTKPRFIILGAGHIAAALAPIAKAADFEVLVYDDRASFANSQRFPDADAVICDGFDRVFERIELRESDYVVIVTRGHRHDTDCLRGILARPEPAYTGMIGSRRRVAIVMDQLRSEASEAVSDAYDAYAARIERVHSPIGLRIGAVTPLEIAISIMAEVIQVKRIERKEAQYSSCDPAIAEELALRGDAYDATITIVESSGSVPIEAGAKLAMSYAGSIAGTIGGGCSEGEAMQVARELINENGARTWRLYTVDMTDSAEEDGMVCGGSMNVVVELVQNGAEEA